MLWWPPSLGQGVEVCRGTGFPVLLKVSPGSGAHHGNLPRPLLKGSESQTGNQGPWPDLPHLRGLRLDPPQTVLTQSLTPRSAGAGSPGSAVLEEVSWGTKPFVTYRASPPPPPCCGETAHGGLQEKVHPDLRPWHPQGK